MIASVDAFGLLKQISVDLQSDRCLGIPDPATNCQHTDATCNWCADAAVPQSSKRYKRQLARRYEGPPVSR
jgi:hypothetical protein